ncbi:MAG: DUF4390 domain-containing protein [Candidatus Methylomirabilales bacterium]
MIDKRVYGILSSVLVLLLALGRVDLASGARAWMGNVILTELQKDVLVFATLQEAFTQEIQESIINGVPTTFTYQIRLMRHRAVFPDAEVVVKAVRQQVAYDLLADEFRLTREDGGEHNSQVTKSYTQVRRWMAELRGVRLIPREKLEAGQLYYVRVKAEIRSVSLVFPLNYLPFFISLFNFDTPWASSSLFRVSQSGQG